MNSRGVRWAVLLRDFERPLQTLDVPLTEDGARSGTSTRCVVVVMLSWQIYFIIYLRLGPCYSRALQIPNLQFAEPLLCTLLTEPPTADCQLNMPRVKWKWLLTRGGSARTQHSIAGLCACAYLSYQKQSGRADSLFCD